MSLRDLTTQKMISLSSEWLDPAGTRSLVESIPAAAGLLPMVGKAHRYLLETQPKPRKIPAELAAIRDEQVEVDAVHDRKARGLYGILTAFAEVVDDREVAASYIELRDKIFPPEQGLRETAGSSRPAPSRA